MITGRSPMTSIFDAPLSAQSPTKQPNEYRVVGQNAPRVDLAAKVFGAPDFHSRHGARRHGACARRTPAAP